MELKAVLDRLEALGDENRRKIYSRHGAGENQYGVKFTDLRKIAKEIKEDYDLAIGLWATGNTDARLLATMIASPGKFEREAIESWVSEIRYYTLMDEFIYNVVARSSHSEALMASWIDSEDEWLGRAGWDLLIDRALKEEWWEDDYFYPYMDRIFLEIKTAPNRKKEAMNNALIAIGMRSDNLEDKAIQVANILGKIEVDHGDTSCKTPDAAAYIKKGRQRKH